MNNIPFLAQFKKERTYDGVANSIELKYDRDLDYNILQSKGNMELMAVTNTRVKVEQPDEVANDFDFGKMYKLYLQTKTNSDIKIEQPDEIEENFYSEYMATQTLTKSINEGSDQDY